MLGQRLYNMLGQRLFNMLGQRLYNMLGQRLYNMLGQHFLDEQSEDGFASRNQRWPNENCGLKPNVGPTSTCYLGRHGLSCQETAWVCLAIMEITNVHTENQQIPILMTTLLFLTLLRLIRLGSSCQLVILMPI